MVRDATATGLKSASRALVDSVVDKCGTRTVAEAYLDFLYSAAAQKIIAQILYRPSKPQAADPADLARCPRSG